MALGCSVWMKIETFIVCALSVCVLASIGIWSFIFQPAFLYARSPPFFLIVDVSPTCGVGNQMFHYAAGMGYALLNLGYTVCVRGFDEVENEAHGLSVFKMVVEVVGRPLMRCPSGVSGMRLPFFKDGVNIAMMESFEPPHSTFLPFVPTGGRSVFIAGCMQSFKYFESVPRPFFRPRKLEAASHWMVQLEGSVTSVVHVRRGDKVKDGSVLAPVGYYEKVLRMLGTSRVAVCTDDAGWVREQRVFQNATISSVDPAFDMALMASATEAVVIGTGTFGWWGAYLSNAKRKFFYRIQYDGKDALGYREADYIPRGMPGQGQWIGLHGL